MKAILGAITLFAVPAFAQTVPATDPRVDNAQLQPAQCPHTDQHHAEGIHKHCSEVKNHDAKTSRRTKTKAEQLTAELNGNGHQGHNH